MYIENGAHNPDWLTPLCPCNGVFTDQFFYYQVNLKNKLAIAGDQKIVMSYSFFVIIYHTTDFHILCEVEPPRPIFAGKVLKNDAKN